MIMSAITNTQATGEIVVGVDTSASGRRALKWAAGYARSMEQPLRAVHVFGHSSEGAIPRTPGGLPGMPYSGANEPRDVTQSEIQAAFDSVAPEAGWHLEFYEGPIGQTLVEKAEHAALLVIGTREHTGIDRVLNGSVSHYCLTRVQCPLVAVPPTPSVARKDAPAEIRESASAR
jgi:nucleotide-binding universal stress UspA family protein